MAVDESRYEQESIQSRRTLERLKRRRKRQDHFTSSTKNLMKKNQNLFIKENSGFNNSDFVQERERPRRQREPIRSSREHPRQSNKEAGACYGRDHIRKSQKQQAQLDYLDSPQFRDVVTRITEKALKDFAKEQRRPTSQPSIEVDGSKSCSKQKQVNQELNTKPTKAMKEPETECEFSVLSTHF